MKKILVLDDETQITNFLNKVLTRDGFYVNVAHRGEEAIQRCQDTEYDLIISDMDLPGISGIETMIKIRETETNNVTPIIFISGSLDSDRVKQTMLVDPYSFIAKPFQCVYLLEQARKAASA